jgi:hypothetical protein
MAPVERVNGFEASYPTIQDREGAEVNRGDESNPGDFVPKRETGHRRSTRNLGIPVTP